MKRRMSIHRLLAYVMVLSLLASFIIIKTPQVTAEEAKPVTYAKYNSELTDVGQARQEGVSYTVNPGTAWVYKNDSVSFDD